MILGLAYLRCTHLLHTAAVSALSKLKQISSVSPKMSYQSMDLDTPCQFTCCNVQILHLYTNYIYFPILPYFQRTLDCHGSSDPLSCLLNNKHELAHTAISDLLILDTGHLCTFCVCKVASTAPSFCKVPSSLLHGAGYHWQWVYGKRCFDKPPGARNTRPGVGNVAVRPLPALKENVKRVMFYC
jgi:hypothetical protein